MTVRDGIVPGGAVWAASHTVELLHHGEAPEGFVPVAYVWWAVIGIMIALVFWYIYTRYV